VRFAWKPQVRLQGFRRDVRDFLPVIGLRPCVVLETPHRDYRAMQQDAIIGAGSSLPEIVEEAWRTVWPWTPARASAILLEFLRFRTKLEKRPSPPRDRFHRAFDINTWARR